VTVRRDRDRGAVPPVAMVVIALVIAAVVGLIAGAVWGQSGSHEAAPATSPTATTTSAAPSPTSTGSPTATSTTQTPSASPTSASPTSTGSATTTATSSSSPTSAPGPTPTGAAPPAPATTTTSANGWRLGPWQITNTSGTLGVDTTARNTATGTRSANMVLYVYVNNALVATTTATVTDVPAGGTVPVHFAGTDPWKPGTKILLLQTS
jgi:hypothetical protein